MLDYIFPIIALVIIAIAVRFAIKERHDTKEFIAFITLGIFFSTFFMVLPTEWVKEGKVVVSQPLYEIISSLLYSFKTLGGRQDIAQLESIGLSGVLKVIYVVINYISFLLAPILASSLILTFVGDFGEKLKLFFSFTKSRHIFSALNHNSLQLAKGIMSKNKKTTVIFCNTKNVDKSLVGEARKEGFITLYKPCENLRFSKNKNYEFYSDLFLPRLFPSISQILFYLNLINFIMRHCILQ